MVSIVEKSEFIKEVSENESIGHIVKLILFEEGNSQELVLNNSASSNAVALLLSIRKHDITIGKDSYNLIQRRQPTRDSDWIFDDFLIFSCVCFVRFYNIDPAWINNVLNLRMSSQNFEVQETTKAYLDIVRGFNDSKTLPQISLVYHNLVGKDGFSFVTQDFLNQLLVNLWRQTFPFYESSFLNIISLKAIEVSFVLKGLLSPEDFFASLKFRDRFNKRSKVIASAVVYLSLAILIAVLLILAYRVAKAPEGSMLWVIGAVFSFLGTGIFSLFTIPKSCIPLLTTGLKRLFGYKF